MRRIITLFLIAFALAGCASATSAPPALTSNTLPQSLQSAAGLNPQFVISGTGISTTVGPGGLWLWSQLGKSNAYGNGGAGSMYFYHVYRSTVPVEVSSVALSGKTITEHAASRDGRVSCDITAVQIKPIGSKNGTVSYTCTAPAGASATNDVVTVKISQ